MDVSVWLALIVLFFSGGLTPGPAVMLVVSASLKYGVKPALLPALGISTANLIYITLAVGGAASVALAFPKVLLALKIAGVCFILWLAVQLVQSGTRDLRGAEVIKVGKAKLFGSGVALQLANPNALVFFGLLLPSYLSADQAVIPQALIIMATVTVTEMFGLTVYAVLANAMAQRFSDPSFARKFNIGAATLMVASAVYAVWSTS
jgi:threonine/homoserine/homoserine lactone efflux protein